MPTTHTVAGAVTGAGVVNRRVSLAVFGRMAVAGYARVRLTLAPEPPARLATG